MTRAYLLLLVLAGCEKSHLLGGTEATGYLGGDACSKNTTEASCTGGCAWVAPTCPAGTRCPPGVCYEPDPCLKLADSASCNANSNCAWSEAFLLCPAGADCGNGGYCHRKNSSGGDCACVTPIACPAGANCAQPECDCSGGNSSSGGSCTCSCPPCAPGETCAPCDCNCVDGGGSGCVDKGTCTCACPTCAAGQDCTPCACDCAGSGPVPAPDDGNTSSTSTSMSSPNGTDPCAAHTDSNSCAADAANTCQWFALGIPCMVGEPCVSGVCQGFTPPPSGMGCGCACPACAPGTECPPCKCDCTDSSGGCVPPDPGNPPTGGGTACPLIGCANPCPNGQKIGADGCPTCECL